MRRIMLGFKPKPCFTFNAGLFCVLALLVVCPTLVQAQWIDDWRLTENPHTSYVSANNARTVAYDDSGHLHVVWYEYLSGHWDIFYRRLTNAGWSDRQQLSATAAASSDPSIVAEGDGTLHVVWEESNAIQYKMFDGASWGTATRLSDSGSLAGVPGMTLGPGGSLHVVWEDRRDGNDEVYYKHFDGMSWGPDERLTVGSGSIDNPAVAADGSGKVHVVWNDDRTGAREIFYKKFDVVWGADEQLTTDSTFTFLPAVEVTNDGAVHVVWTDLRTGDYEVFYKKHGGAGWGPDTRLTFYPGLAWNTSIAVNDSGHLHVVWHDNRNGNTEIYHKMFDGSSWQLDERLTSDPATSKNPSVAADNEGNVYVVWHDFRDGSYEIYWKWFIGGTPPKPEITSMEPSVWPADEGVPIGDLAGSDFMWLAQVWLQKAGEPDLPATEVVVREPDQITCTVGLGGAAEGYWNVVVQNVDGQMDTLASALRVVAGPWISDTRLTDDANASHTSKPNARCVAADHAGNTHVVWYDNRDGNDEIYYKRHDGVSWGADERLTDTPLESLHPSIAVDVNDNLHVAWCEQVDATSSEIYYKMFDGVSWAPDERLTNAPAQAKTPSIAAGSDSSLYVVWIDYRNGPAHVYFKRYNGSSWLPDSLIGQLGYHDDAPVIVVDGNEYLHVVWSESDAGSPPVNVNYRMNNGTGWSAIEVLSTGTTISAPSMAVDDNDHLYVCWVDSLIGAPGGHEVFYRFFDGMTWDTAKRLSRAEGKSHNASVAAADSGIVFVVYADERDGNNELYFRRFDGSIWEAETRLTFDAAESRYPSTATDGDRLHVVWCDERDGNPEIYYKLRDPETVSGIPGAEPQVSPIALVTIAPNPVVGDALVRFSLGRRATARVSVYDIAGRLVWQHDLGIRDPGKQQLRWDTRDRFGNPVAPGIYFVNLKAGTQTATAKLAILR